MPVEIPVKFSKTNRSKMLAIGRVIVTLRLGGLSVMVEFLVTDFFLVHNVILGCNFFIKYKADIRF